MVYMSCSIFVDPGTNQHFYTIEDQVPLFPAPEMPGKGPAWLSLVDMTEVENFPFDFALYFSTDHQDTGGIWMYLCKGNPSDPKDWKSYDQAVIDGDFDYLKEKPIRNPIFVDKIQGASTETPHLNVINNQVYLTYHNLKAGRTQSTLLATSFDGVNYNRINGLENSVILDYKDGPGDGHTGYFRWRGNPFTGVDFNYIGYSLHGGGDNYYMAMWGSNDAKDWNRLQIFNSLEGIVEKDMILNWHGMMVNSIQRIEPDLYVAIMTASTKASGTDARLTKYYEVFLGSDGFTLKREPREIGIHETNIMVNDTWYWVFLSPDRSTFYGSKGFFNPNGVKTPEMLFERQKKLIFDN